MFCFTDESKLKVSRTAGTLCSVRKSGVQTHWLCGELSGSSKDMRGLDMWSSQNYLTKLFNFGLKKIYVFFFLFDCNNLIHICWFVWTCIISSVCGSVFGVPLCPVSHDSRASVVFAGYLTLPVSFSLHSRGQSCRVRPRSQNSHINGKFSRLKLVFRVRVHFLHLTSTPAGWFSAFFIHST